MQNYVCNLCGYIYKPTEHDNVDFENLDEQWQCPICMASKDDFSPIE